MKKLYSKILVALVATFTLVGCDTTEKPNIPQNYTDPVATVLDGDDVNFNTLDQYYNAFSDQNEVTLNNLLLKIAEKVTNGEIKDREDDSKTLSLLSSEISDLNDPTASANSGSISTYFGVSGDSKNQLNFKGIGTELNVRGKEALRSKIVNGSYTYNGRFDENKLIDELNKDLLLDPLKDANGVAAKTTLDYNEMRILNDTATYDEVFLTAGGQVKDGTADYSTYIKDSLYPEIVRNKLIAQYIYNEKFGNIALDRMQKLNVLTITDRTDISGAARRFINAYYNHYQESGSVDPSFAGKPLEEMERLWNGIGYFDDDNHKNAIYTLDNGTTVDPKLEQYGWSDQYENYLTTTQKQWLADNNIDTLFDKITDDYYKATQGDEDEYNTFSSSKTQDIQKGLISQIDNLLSSDIRQEGIYTKTSLSGVDSTVTDRVFATHVSEGDLTKKFKDSEDLMFYYPVVSEQSTSAPVFYASGAYTFVQLEVNYNSTTLGSSNTDNAAKGNQAIAYAMEAAYEMVSESTYKTDAVTYWIKNYGGKSLNFTVHNESFYNYLDEAYPDLFDDDK